MFILVLQSLAGSLPSAGMMDAFPGLSQSPFFDMRYDQYYMPHAFFPTTCAPATASAKDQ